MQVKSGVLCCQVNFWARTMKARIPILEAQAHWELWKLGRLPNAVAWADLEAFAAWKKTAMVLQMKLGTVLDSWPKSIHSDFVLVNVEKPSKK